MQRVFAAALALWAVGPPGWAQFDAFDQEHQDAFQLEPETGLFDRPIRRYAEVIYDFLDPPPLYTPLGALTMDPDDTASLPVLEPLPAPLLPSMRALSEVATQLGLGDASVGGVTMPSLCLHAQGPLLAEVMFPAITLPERQGRWMRIFLLVQAALSEPLVDVEPVASEPAPDGEAGPEDESVPEDEWVPKDDAEEPLPPSATFTVTVNDQPVFVRTVGEGPWAMQAVDLTEYAGQVISVVFGAAAPDPEGPGAVLCLGRPMLIREQGPYYLAPAGRSVTFGLSLARFRRYMPGLALVQLRCDEPSAVQLVAGESVRQVSLEPGSHWVPVPFENPDRFSFAPVSGDPEFLRLDIAPFTPPAANDTPEGPDEPPPPSP